MPLAEKITREGEGGREGEGVEEEERIDVRGEYVEKEKEEGGEREERVEEEAVRDRG